jgi:hypothetical protein
MLIRNCNTSYRLEAGTDEGGNLRFVIRWCAPTRRKPTALEEEELAWLLRELRRECKAPVVLLGVDVPAAAKS